MSRRATQSLRRPLRWGLIHEQRGASAAAAGSFSTAAELPLNRSDPEPPREEFPAGP